MIIPKSFCFFFSKVNVKFSPDLDRIASLRGQAYFDNSKNEYDILLEPNSEKNILICTFFHEFYHQLFHALERRDLCKDDDLVELMAKLTTQAYLSAEYEEQQNADT